MKALDLLNHLPEYLPREGKFLAHGRRALLIDIAPFEALRAELLSLLGQEQAARSFERFGYVMGHQAARRLRDRYHWDNEREWFAAAPVLIGWTGLACARLHQLDIQRARGIFFAEISWTDSFESEQQIQRAGLAQSPVCRTLTGYLSGYFSFALGHTVLCLESECVATGQTRCLAQARAIAAWGEAARKNADLLRFESINKIQHPRKRQEAPAGEALKEARFQALQNQVNPHFFFNTINIIARLAFLENASETEAMAYALADLMRYSLRRFADSDGLVSLRDELEHARQYLLIQSTRFRDRLTLNFEIDQTALDTRVPPLSLQPLIENAFVHGLERSERAGQLLLSIQRAREYVVVSVQDNGIGMSREQVYKLLHSEEAEEESIVSRSAHTTGLGLAHVRDRLRHYYGERCQLTIESEAGSGTTVRLLLYSEGTAVERSQQTP